MASDAGQLATVAIETALLTNNTLKALATDTTNPARTAQLFDGQPQSDQAASRVNPNYFMWMEETAAPDYSWSRRTHIDLTFMLKGVARSTAAMYAMEIAKAMRAEADATLTDYAGFSITGYRIGRRRAFGFFSYEESDGGVQYAHAGFRYRLRLFPL